MKRRLKEPMNFNSHPLTTHEKALNPFLNTALTYARDSTTEQGHKLVLAAFAKAFLRR